MRHEVPPGARERRPRLSQLVVGGDARPPPLASRRRPVLSAARIAAVLLWTVAAATVQVAVVRRPGRARVRIARAYWAGVCRLIGLEIRVLGAPLAGAGAGPQRAVVFVSNHSSWLDIPVLGARLPACFVAKEEVAGWPLVGTLAWLGRTIFVSRNRASTGREREDMGQRLAQGDNLVLFPEGTSSDGSRVLPFHSSFLAVAEAAPGRAPPIVQPVSIVFDRIAHLPVGRVNRASFSWYGDMDLGPHAWRLGMVRGMRASLLLHPPLDPAAFPSRKELSQAAWAAVAHGAAALRQNREPIITEAPLDFGAADPGRLTG